MPPIIGTAGHIDHGKTSLVRALTGQETDRLAEERARGISIDLGFAHFDGPGGVRSGVVDVPGHERFIRNMLAGAHGMDLVLFVVAADDGVMPQTEEHLDIVHLLGVRRGVFVITKTDLVDAARVAAVREEIQILTLDTTLQGAPIVPVSSTTGAGMDALRDELLRQLETGVAPPSGRFRLPVDRAFVIHGHGVVVTGTAIAGRVAEGDTVRLQPDGSIARVRSIEVHGAAVPMATGGQRVALNLGGVERHDLQRGDVVCDPRLTRSTDRFDAWVEVRPGARRALRHHGRVRLHIGTAEILAKTVLLAGNTPIPPRGAAPVQVVLDEPTLVLRGDRFILRDETARWTLAGGQVLHPHAPRHASRSAALALLDTLRTGDATAMTTAIVETTPGFAIARGELAQTLDLDEAGVVVALATSPAVVPIPDAAHPDAWTTTARWDELSTRVLAAIADVHRTQPLLPGVEMESLRTQLPWKVETPVFRWAIERLVGSGVAVRDDNLLRLPSHAVALGDDARQLGERLVTLLAAGGFTPPDLRQLAAETAAAPVALRDVLTVLEQEQRVVRVAPDLYYDPAATAAALERLRAHCQVHGEITAATWRDLIGASRKFAIALLDWTDRTGVTVRVGDARRLRR